MELAKIETLLEQYFDGNTTTEQEAQLQDYFAQGQVPEHLAAYGQLFSGFAQIRQQRMEAPVNLPQAKQRKPFWGYAIAAVIVVALGIGFVLNSTSQGLSVEQQQAMAAFEETKKALQMLSGNLNNGIEGMAHLSEFDKATEQIFK